MRVKIVRGSVCVCVCVCVGVEIEMCRVCREIESECKGSGRECVFRERRRVYRD